MRNFKRLISVLILIVLVGAVMAFVLENRAGADLRFLGWALPALPVSVYVLMAFCIGLLLGALSGVCQFLFRWKKS